MLSTRLALLFGTLLALMTTICHAGGDEVNGEKLARKWCASCHNIESGGPLTQHPPSFASIAVNWSADQIHGQNVYPKLHSNMPQIGYVLTPANVDHLAAYIRSLKPQ